MNTKILGHRGASAYRPENTLEAFSLALEQKADGFELDVHLTKDGHIVVAHDERLERVSDGVGYINNYTLSELKNFNFNKRFPEQPVCRIPTLNEVYELVKGSDAVVNVELKTTELLYPELPEKLLRLEREYSMKERVIYSSFNHYSLLEMKKLDPTVKTGLLYDLGLVDPWVYAKHTAADAIHPHFIIVAMLPETVARCHEAGILVNVWVVNDPKMMEAMFMYNVDIVMTDKPDTAVTCRENMKRS